MISKQRAIVNTVAAALPLYLGLLYSALFNPGLPYNVIIPTIGGGLMNFSFWLFYNSTLRPIPELSKSLLTNNRKSFLLIALLHVVAIAILLVHDIKWIFELL